MAKNEHIVRHVKSLHTSTLLNMQDISIETAETGTHTYLRRNVSIKMKQYYGIKGYKQIGFGQ